MTILNDLGNKIILFDGALGTQIQQEVPDAKIPYELNMTNPDLLKRIHASYIEAGADVITTNTFGANDIKLKDSKYTIENIITMGVKNAKEVAKDKYVALDIAPLGKMFDPIGDMTFEFAYEQFKKQVIAGEKAGCDLIIIETMSDILEAKVAVLAAKENTSLPVFCSMTFNERGRTFTGLDPITMVAVLEGLGVDCIGVNCSVGPDKLISVVEKIAQYASVPIIVQPNAGLPVIKENKTVYDITKEEFTAYMKEIINLGVTVIGGCCGTTPEYIKELKNVVDNTKPKILEKKNHTIITSSRNSVIIDDGITVIGEALVPTGRKQYSEALLNGNYSFITKSAKEQKKLGAQIIDLNVSVPGINEKETMLEAIKQVQSSMDIPLQLDSINPEIMEAGIRCYAGKPTINSVNGTEESMKKIFPIAKKYGACIIGMAFDEKGIVQSVEDRLKIAKRIVNTAKEYGINKKDIIIDCLSLTATAHQDSLIDTLKLVKLVKETLGVKTMLGVANVSYGLPNRSLLDRTYFAMALSFELDIIMMSVYDSEMMDTINAYNVLANIDVRAVKYNSTYLKAKDKSSTDNSKNLSISNKKGKIVLASVKGDTINIGKNILKDTLNKNGYRVIDLGVNIEAETILKTALDENASIIGLSAFAVSSLNNLKEAVEYIKKQDSDVKLMVGGAAVTKEFCKEIGIKLYAKNAKEAVEMLDNLC
ncbi:MAG: homocysteine S-methyltransferase family protein [Eubacteriaceae bacterium]